MIPETGYTPAVDPANIAGYESSNTLPSDFKGTFYFEGNLSAVQVIGKANEHWEGCVAKVTILAGGSNGAKITLYDSNDPAAVANKRYIEIGGGSPAGSSTVGQTIDTFFRFREGLVVASSGDTSGALRVLVIVPYQMKAQYQ